MFLKYKIFGSVNILKVSFRSSSGYDCILFKSKYGKDGTEIEGEGLEGEAEKLLQNDKAVPYIILYTGYGVISKNREILPSKIAEKLIPGNREFLWEEDNDNCVTLLRREQASGIENIALESGARIIGITVCPNDAVGDISGCVAKYLDNAVKFKRLLKSDRIGSELSRLVFDKLKLPVLGILLILLTANYFVGERVRAGLSRLQVEVQAKQRIIGSAGESDRQKNALFEKYNRPLPHGFSWICDRVAIVLPPSMLLTSLKLQPLTKKIENGKELEITERQVEITGNAGNTEDIMLYISALKKLEFAREVRMVSFEQERNSSDLFFKLMLFL